MKIIEGKLLAEGMKIGIVAARFNEFIVSKLLAGAEDALLRHGANGDDITAAWVPGAFEIPTAAQKMAQSGKYDAVICLGAVIRGSTSHYDYVCNEVSKGVAQIALQTGVPTLFGVVTTENIEQAIERAGTKAGNKGYDAAMAAIEMVNLSRQLYKGTILPIWEGIFLFTQQQAGAAGNSVHDSLCVPGKARHIHTPVREELNAVRFKHRALDIAAAEGKCGRGAAVFGDHAVAGRFFRIGVDMQGITDHPRPARIARKPGHLPIACHSPARDGAHDFVNAFKTVHLEPSMLLVYPVPRQKTRGGPARSRPSKKRKKRKNEKA